MKIIPVGQMHLVTKDNQVFPVGREFQSINPPVPQVNVQVPLLRPSVDIPLYPVEFLECDE
jgi:hypothetical protein